MIATSPPTSPNWGKKKQKTPDINPLESLPAL
jgi:hypothetical protein